MSMAGEFLVAGASAIQVGTVTFADPTLADRIIDELPSKLSEAGVSDVIEVIGALKSNKG